MKTLNRIARLAVVVAACGLAAGASAADMLKYRAKPGSKMRMEGSSNIHAWTSESTLVGGRLELDPSFPVDPAKKELAAGKVNASATVNILVRTFKCSSGSAMDAVMQETMNAKDFPKIEYKLKELTFKEFKNDALQFDAVGDLTIKGQTKTLTHPVQITRPDASSLKVSGTTTVKMTDFGIQPPAPKIALGMIKTDDDVKLVFDWNLQKTEAAAATN